MIKALAFDLFGTLIDNSSISKVFPELDIRVDIKSFLETCVRSISNMLGYSQFLTDINRLMNCQYEP